MKIYNEIILQWNDKTQLYDVVYEDSYDYSGKIDLAAKKGSSWGSDKENLNEARSVVTDIEKDIKRVAKGMKEWDKGTEKLNQNLQTTLETLIKEEKVTDDIIRATTGVIDASMDVVDVEQMVLEKKNLIRLATDGQIDLEEDYIKQLQHEVEILGGIAAQADHARQETEAIQKETETWSDTLDGVKSVGQSIDGVMGGMIGTITGIGEALMGPMGILGGIAAILAVVVDSLQKSAEITDAVGASFGVAGGNTKELWSQLHIVGLEVGDIHEMMNTVSSDFGISTHLAKGFAVNMGDSAVAMGMSTGEMGTLIGQMMTFGDLSYEAAEELTKQAYALAESEGVVPNAALKDLASSSEDIAKFSSQTPEHLMKAAIQAKKMGMSFGDIVGSMDSMLEVSDSLGKELEAEVLLNQDLDLSRLRQLSLADDMVGYQNEIKRIVGSIGGLDDLNRLEKGALADALGMTIPQLVKISSASDEVNEKMGELGDQDISFIEGANAVDKMTQLSNSWDVTMANMGNDMKEVIPQLQKASDSIQNLMTGWVDMAKKLNDTFGGGILTWMAAVPIGAAVVGKALWKMVKPKSEIASLTNAIKGMTGGVDAGISKAPKIPTKTGGGFTNFMKGVKPTTMLAGAASMAIIAGAMWILAKALQEFSTGVSWEGVKMAGVVMLGAIVAAIATGAAAAAAGPLFILGAAAILVIAGAMWIMAKAAQEFAVAGAMMMPTFDKMVLLDSAKLIGAAKGIGAIGLALAGFGAGSVGAGIGSLVGDFLGGDPIKKFKKFGSMGPSLMMTATAMKTIGQSIDLINTDKMVTLAESMDKLSGSAGSLSVSMVKLSAGNLISSSIEGVKNAASGIFNWVGNIIGGNKPEVGKTGDDIATLNSNILLLINNFDKKYVPAIVASNIEGAKRGADQFARNLKGT